MQLCKYRHIFGKEGEGVHSIRLFNIAVVDLVLTVIGSYFISMYFDVSFWPVLLVVLVISVLVHKLFCVDTTFTRFIFGG